MNLSSQDAFILLTGIIIGRALVSTVNVRVLLEIKFDCVSRLAYLYNYVAMRLATCSDGLGL